MKQKPLHDDKCIREMCTRVCVRIIISVLFLGPSLSTCWHTHAYLKTWKKQHCCCRRSRVRFWANKGGLILAQSHWVAYYIHTRISLQSRPPPQRSLNCILKPTLVAPTAAALSDVVVSRSSSIVLPQGLRLLLPPKDKTNHASSSSSVLFFHHPSPAHARERSRPERKRHFRIAECVVDPTKTHPLPAWTCSPGSRRCSPDRPWNPWLRIYPSSHTRDVVD